LSSSLPLCFFLFIFVNVLASITIFSFFLAFTTYSLIGPQLSFRKVSFEPAKTLGLLIETLYYFRYDPEAAHVVFTSGIPILVYPWDVYLKVGCVLLLICSAFADSLATSLALSRHRGSLVFCRERLQLGSATAFASGCSVHGVEFNPNFVGIALDLMNERPIQQPLTLGFV
jgi:hypothetical protein